jgi:hypothetical protein
VTYSNSFFINFNYFIFQINKYIETENIIESEKNKEEEKKIIIEELETKKLEEKIKAYDAEQELKKKGHDQHDIPEVEANRSAEIEKDRKKLAAAKEKIEIQKKNLNRKKIDRLNREAGKLIILNFDLLIKYRLLITFY